MVTTVKDAGNAREIYVITRDPPLSWQGAVAIFTIVSIPILLVAIVSGIIATWFVLPVSLSVIAALGAGLRIGYVRSQVREIVSVASDSVLIERGVRGPEERYEIPRDTAQVILQQAEASDTGHLFISSIGTEVEIGEFLDTTERRELAGKLRALFAPGALSGQLAGAQTAI